MSWTYYDVGGVDGTVRRDVRVRRIGTDPCVGATSIDDEIDYEGLHELYSTKYDTGLTCLWWATD